MFIAGLPLHALALAQIAHKRIKGGRLHPGHAQGADLLLVCQHADGRAAGRLGQVQQGLKAGVGADPVVLAVGTDHGPVQADVHGLGGGDSHQLGGEEVLLHHAVLLVENGHDRQLHPVSPRFLIKGTAADKEIQLLGGHDRPHGLLGLVPRQMGQQVAHGKLRVAGVLADAHGHGGPVLQDHQAVQGQGDGGPLVLLDAPVVMGLAVGHFLVFVQRVLLQVQAGGVDVGRADDGALRQALLPDHSQHNGLAAIIIVDLVTGLELLAPDQGPEPGGFRLGDGVGHAFPLDLAFVQEGLVARAVVLNGLLLAVRQTVVAVGGAEKQGVPLLLGRGLFVFFHGLIHL